MQALLNALGSNALSREDRAVVMTCRKGRIRYLNELAEQVFTTDLPSAQTDGWQAMLPDSDCEQLDEIERSLLTCREQSGNTSGKSCVEWEVCAPGDGRPMKVQPRSIVEGEKVLGILWEFVPRQRESEVDDSKNQRNHRYQRIFKSSAVAHSVLDIEPLYRRMKELGLTDEEKLSRYLENTPEFYDTIRSHIAVIEANDAFLNLYGVRSIEQWNSEVVANFRAEDLVHAAYAVLAVDAGSGDVIYYTDLQTLNGERKDLWVSAELPTPDNISDGILVSALDITVMKATEEELEERQQFLGTILRTIPDFLFVYDFARREHIFANADLGEYLGYSKEQVAEAGDKLFSYVIHPDDMISRSKLREFVQAISRNEIYEHTMRLQDSEGEWRYFYFRCAMLERTEAGDVVYSVVVARDITDILKTQQSLNEKERRFRLLEENFSDIILCTDENLNVDYVSPSLSVLLGYQPDGFLALDNPARFGIVGLSDYLNELLNDYEIALRQCRKLAYEGEEYQRIIESEAVHQDGTRIPVEIKVTLLLGQQHKELQGMLILCRDIRERYRIDADLRLAAKVFENSLEGIYITNEKGYIAQVNKAFTDITGYTEEYSVGKRPAFLSSGWHESHFSSEIEPVLSASGYWQGELINRRSSGEVFPASVGITEVRSKSDQLLGYITTFRDITEAKNSEQRIRKLAYFDPLTDLPNRSLFLDRLNQELHRAQRNGSHVALLFLDLDRFKSDK